MRRAASWCWGYVNWHSREPSHKFPQICQPSSMPNYDVTYQSISLVGTIYNKENKEKHFYLWTSLLYKIQISPEFISPRSQENTGYLDIRKEETLQQCKHTWGLSILTTREVINPFRIKYSNSLLKELFTCANSYHDKGSMKQKSVTQSKEPVSSVAPFFSDTIWDCLVFR